MRILTAGDVNRLFGMAEAMTTTEIAAVAHTRGRAGPASRSALRTDRPDGEFLVMPGVVEGSLFGVKTWYTATLTGERRTEALITVLDPDTGEETLLDGSVITDMRTGAMTALAASRLAPASARTAAIIGTGIQARTQILALAHVLPGLSTIRVTSRSEQRRESFAESMRHELTAPSPRVLAVADAEAACTGADVVVAATTSTEPVVLDEWIGDDVLVCGVGSHSRDAAELDPRLMARATIVAVDTISGGIDGAGDVSIPIELGWLDREDVVELGRLLMTTPPPPRGVRVFKSVGFAAADIVAAHRVARDARVHGLGMHIDIHGAPASG